MIGKINNVSFGALYVSNNYNIAETRKSFDREFDTPELKKAALGVLEAINDESTKQGKNFTLDFIDVKINEKSPNSRQNYFSMELNYEYKNVLSAYRDTTCCDAFYENPREDCGFGEPLGDSDKLDKLEQFKIKAMADIKRCQPTSLEGLGDYKKVLFDKVA